LVNPSAERFDSSHVDEQKYDRLIKSRKLRNISPRNNGFACTSAERLRRKGAWPLGSVKDSG